MDLPILHNICSLFSRKYQLNSRLSDIIIQFIWKGLSSSILASSALVDPTIKFVLYKNSRNISALSQCCRKKLSNNDCLLSLRYKKNLILDVSMKEKS